MFYVFHFYQVEEKNVYMQRQSVLKEIDTLRNRENELRMRTESFERWGFFFAFLSINDSVETQNEAACAFKKKSNKMQRSLWRCHLCFHWQDLPDPRGEGEEHRGAAEEARTGSENPGGHVRPKAEKRTFKVILPPLFTASFSQFHQIVLPLELLVWLLY